MNPPAAPRIHSELAFVKNGHAAGLGLHPAPVSQTIALNLALDNDTLQASLSDGGAVFLVGELFDVQHRLAGLQRSWRADNSGEPSPIQSFGQALFDALLPPRIKTFLADSPGCELRLCLAPSLAGVPWEAAFDGHRFWASCHAVTRSILGAAPVARSDPPVAVNPGPLRVLLASVTGLSPLSEDHLRNLQAGLNELPQLALDCLTQEQLRDGSSAHQDSAARVFDVVHLAGNVDAILHALEVDAYLSQLARQAGLLVLDDLGDVPDTTDWRETGQRLAALLSKRPRICTIQRLGVARGDVRQLARFYEAAGDGVKLGEAARRSAPGDAAPQQLIGFFGDAGFSLRAVAQAGAAERSFRQVTSLSYDLVGSTDLMQRKGVEAYSIALLEYHRRFAAIIKQWGGTSDEPQGDDGIMCYFGALQAREDSVRSAIFAAIDLIEEARRNGIEIRIGMATGQVAVNETHFVGLSVHLAARIQSLASPGEILVSGTTAELARTHFGFEPFNYSQTLKGFSNPASVFKVEQARAMTQWSRWSSGNETALVGRESEVNQLLAKWEQVRDGHGIWLRVSGEAGIGKTRLISAFAQNLETAGEAEIFICRCFPETQSSAFGPVIDLLERWFQIQPTDDCPTRQSRVERTIETQGITDGERQAVSHLLGLSAGQAADLQRPLGTEPRRHTVLESMAGWMVRQANAKPLLFVMEDIQWADPSTLEFLDQLKSASARSALMTIVTERSERPAPQGHEFADEAMHIGRLSSPAVRELIRTLASSTTISRHLVNAIEAKSDGVPLFVEMSTRIVIESGQHQKPDDAPESQMLPIPQTVHGLLMQRLDSLGPARQLAQLCGAIGREFSLELLDAVTQNATSPVSPAQLRHHLGILIQSGLLLASRHQANQHFYFGHALIQDVAYQSMWESDRRILHQGIAQTLESRFPETCKTEPEILAHHLGASGQHQAAVKWHLLSAKKHKGNEAHYEALAHLGQAKHWLQSLKAAPARDKQELDIELMQAGQLIATKGYGSESVGQCYRRALALSLNLQDKKALLRAQLGIEAYHFLRGDFAQAHAYIAQAQRTAAEFNDGLTIAQCQWAVANILFHQGEVRTALDKMDECVAGCQRAGLKTSLVQSPQVMSLMYSSFCLWALGFADQALVRADAAVTLAESMKHRLGIGQALGMKGMVQLVCGDTAGARLTSERAVSVCESGDHEMWTAHARFINGCAIAGEGELERGLAIMDDADALWAATGAILTRSFYLVMRAQVNLQLLRHDRARELVAEARKIVVQHGERYFEAEVLRVEGEILLADGATAEHRNEVEMRFNEAIATAQARQLKALDLRARLSLCRLIADNGQPARATTLLNSILAEFHEGKDTHDYKAAKSFLAVLTNRFG